jgi:ATP-dependent RNA helicase DBP3
VIIFAFTLGRLKDLINEKSCDLKDVSQLVLDEADRMLDMGFEEDVRYIISKCLPSNRGRQTAMFSATWPAAIQKIAMEFMNSPVRIYVGFEAIIGSNGENNVDDSLSANKRVEQNIEILEDRAREPRLRQILKMYYSKAGQSKPKILIFALYKKEAARLETFLQRDGWANMVNSIHGDLSQDLRLKALNAFKTGTCPLLVATDVAAR